MVTMNFTPYISVGAIKFGEAREEVRKTLGTFKAYKKNKFSANTLDDFGFVKCSIMRLTRLRQLRCIVMPK